MATMNVANFRGLQVGNAAATYFGDDLLGVRSDTGRSKANIGD
jgi:hypothetical protein